MAADYPLTTNDILSVLSSMLKARLIAAGEYGPLVFEPGRSTRALSFDLDRLKTWVPGLDRDIARIEQMFGCPELPRPVTNARHWASQVLEHLEIGPRQRVIFYTSGSTGSPMPNPHDYRLLEQEIGCQCEHLPPVKRVVSFVFAHHIYGFLFSILLPKALQCPVLSLPPFPSKKAISSLRPGDLVLGFPLFWDRFLATGQGVPDQVYGVTSTAPCPKESIMGLLDLGFCSIVEVYGSSETGGIGVRQDPGQPYTLLSCWERPTSDQQSALWRVDPEPRAWQFFALPDRLIWYGPRTFLPQGRKDKAVQVAGHNVYPERVRQCILTQPMVQDCLVRLMRQEEGDRLKAFIVLKDPSVDQVEARREIVRWMSQGLSSAETPGKISFGQRLPRNSMGKLSDW